MIDGDTVVAQTAGVFPFCLQPGCGCWVDAVAMKPTTLLSSLFALALTSVVFAEEPGRPPERRMEGDRDKPRERGPEAEVRKAEPASEGEAALHAPGKPAKGSGKRDGEKKPDRKSDEGRPEGHKGKDGDMHKDKGGAPHPEGKEGMQGRHEGPGHPGKPQDKPEMHKGPGSEKKQDRGAAPHPHPGAPEGMMGRHEGPGHPVGPQVNHVMEAIKHLHAAGMHEVASLLEAKAKMPGHPGGPGRPSMGMRNSHMMKPPFAQRDRRGPGHQGREMQRGPRPEGEKKPEGKPKRG